MADIKTKESVKTAKGGPRKLDRSLLLADKVKDTAVRTNDYVRDKTDDGEVTPEEYAENKIKYAAEDTLDKTKRDAEKGFRKAKEQRRFHKEKAAEKAERKTVEKASEGAGRSARRSTKDTETAASSARSTEQS